MQESILGCEKAVFSVFDRTTCLKRQAYSRHHTKTERRTKIEAKNPKNKQNKTQTEIVCCLCLAVVVSCGVCVGVAGCWRGGVGVQDWAMTLRN